MVDLVLMNRINTAANIIKTESKTTEKFNRTGVVHLVRTVTVIDDVKKDVSAGKCVLNVVTVIIDSIMIIVVADSVIIIDIDSATIVVMDSVVFIIVVGSIFHRS